MPGRESVGFLHDDAPYLKIGQGPPLVMVPGLTPDHDVPGGWQRRLAEVVLDGVGQMPGDV